MLNLNYTLISILTLFLFACATPGPLEPVPQADTSNLTEEEVISLVKEKLDLDYESTSKSDDLYDKVSCGVLFDRGHIDSNSLAANYIGDGIWFVTLPSYKLDIKRTVTYSWTVSDEDSSVISTGLIENPDWVEIETRKVC